MSVDESARQIDALLVDKVDEHQVVYISGALEPAEAVLGAPLTAYFSRKSSSIAYTTCRNEAAYASAVAAG